MKDRLLSSAALLSVLVLALGVRTVRADTLSRGMTMASDTTQDVTDLRELGANLVAYQIVAPDIGNPTSETEYFNWLESKLTVIDSLLSTCEGNGMKMLLVLYSPPGVLNQSSVPARHRVFESDAYTRQFIDAWKLIANRYKDRPGIWGYDLLNEPAVGRIGPGIKLWNTLSQDALAAIRAIDPDVRVAIEPPYGNSEFINKLARIRDSNVVYSIHSYFTTSFRNQGLSGRPINIPYPKANKKNPKKGFNKASLQASLAKAVTFQRLRKGTKIIVGEFAAPRWAPKNSALRYLRDSINIFQRFKWSWANHAWREANVWSPEYSTNPNDNTPSPTMTDREALLRKFFRKNSF